MILENAMLSLTLQTHAAEMHSLIDKRSSQELLWQADPTFWAYRNPILFPIVGSTFDKKIHLFGQEYEMGNHGFARQLDFQLRTQDEHSVTMGLHASVMTRKQYPFEFDLEVTYTLSANQIKIEYRVRNEDKKDMPFSIGFHPAFMLDDTDAAILSFPSSEKNELISAAPHRVLMNDAFFSQEPTLLLEYPASPYVDLNRPNVTIRVGCSGFRWLAFWKKTGANFICIEPWHGHGDFAETAVDFYHREGTVVLVPNEEYRTSYTIEVL